MPITKTAPLVRSAIHLWSVLFLPGTTSMTATPTRGRKTARLSPQSFKNSFMVSSLAPDC